MRTLVWFRSDLRVRDHPALRAACDAETQGVVGVFVLTPEQWRRHDWGGNRVWFLLESLRELGDALGLLNIPLRILEVPTFDDVPDALLTLARELECHALFHHQEYEVNERRRDERVREMFDADDRGVTVLEDQTIVPPDTLRTTTDRYYTVFTPFRKRWLQHVETTGVPSAVAAPRARAAAPCSADPVPEGLEGFTPSIDLTAHWTPGEAAGGRRLRTYARDLMHDYAEVRDLPGLDRTSRLSPHLAIGTVSARQCLAAAIDAADGRLIIDDSGPGTWISELVWREFYRHVLVGFPRVCRHRPFKLDTERIEWRDSAEHFEAWSTGHTGVPIVDAAMRQLLETGWMHNRLRMISAMFLAKHLLLDWRLGERHFMRHLVDGDLASNNGGWQWAASTGTDAVPYFRVFNPYRQGKRFDADGAFIRRFVPELHDVRASRLHDEPASGESIAPGYPAPVVDHGAARTRAIETFKALRG